MSAAKETKPPGVADAEALARACSAQPAQSGMGARERAEKAANEIAEYITGALLLEHDAVHTSTVNRMADIIERAWAGEGK